MHTPIARPLTARTFASMLAMASLAAIAPSIAAQPDAEPAAEQAAAPQEDGSLLPMLRFPGGTVEEYIAAIQKASRVQFNVIVHPSASNATLPAISIVNSEPIYALQAIDGMTYEREGGLWNLTTTLAKSPYEGVSSVRASQQMQSARHDATRTTTEVLDFSEIVKPERAQGSGPSLDDVLAAVTTAVEQANANGAPDAPIGSPFPTTPATVQAKIALHRETGLLFVTGTPDQIRAASQVVQRLKARGASWTEMTELVQRANESDREWFVSQLNIAMRGVEGTSIAASDSDKSLVTVKAPANAKLAVELLGRYLLSPEVQSQRTQVTLQALVEQTRLQTRLQILEQELASARQSHLGREAELRAENQRLRDQMETLRAPGR